MHLGAPHLVALSPGEASALAALAGVVKPLSGREVARLSRAPRSTVARALQHLVEHGLVEVQEAGAGAALLYTLNREHLAAAPLLQLLNLREKLIEELRVELRAWPITPCHGSLFGSAARADGDTQSDVDLFIVRSMVGEDDVWQEQQSSLVRKVHAWTGNHASVIDVSLNDVDRLRRERPKIVTELERDAITLFGPDALTLFRVEA